ncbi:O-antigen ligase family protein [Microlunatus capsulatus]|uniref:O-antigen ligase n=1 Tax=Microlunatus capsulatus TaxID=99117 RepID=A0ABS4Z4J7_9ACTN|nr:O-antigen ligase family protein [Microlunatus capsulatus]MBP2415926.1 O-antigen ligase [Microlunatus capsulatus]
MTAVVALGGGLVLVALLVLALVRPEVALLALVGLDVSNLNQVVADQVGVSPYRPLLLLALVALFVLLRRRRLVLRWSPVTLGLLVLFAGFCASLFGAADPAASQELLVSRARDLLYYLVVLGLVVSLRRVVTLAQVVVLVLAGLAGLTVVHEYLLGNSGDLFGLSRVPLVQEGGASTPRHAGTSSDVNFWARLLILVTPLALSLWAGAGRWRPRVVWAGCVLALLLGVYLTQSRGGFIALFVGLVTWLLLAGGRYRRSVLLLPVLLVVLVPLSGIGSRLLTLTAVTSSSTATADPSVVTRQRLQIDAWHMFLDRPLTGHGIGSYGTLFPRYDRLADYYTPVDIVVAAHNFYLEQAADGGVVLLLAWLVFAGTVLFAALRSRAVALRAGRTAEALLAVGVVAGVIGWAVASVFLHLSDFRAVLVVAALAAALDLRAAEQPAAAVAAPVAPVPHRRLAVAGWAALAVAAAVGCVTAASASSTVWTSTSALAVVTARSGDPSTSYQLDVVTRGQIVPTLTAVVQRSSSLDDLAAAGAPADVLTVDADQSRLGGAVVVRVSAASAEAADGAAAAAVRLATQRVSALQEDYVLRGEPAPAEARTPVARWLAAPLGLLAVAAAALAVRTGRRRDDRPEPVTGTLVPQGRRSS